MGFFTRRVRRTRSGDFEIRLPEQERELLANLVPQLRTALTDGAGDGATGVADPGLRRLFPSAYVDDPEHDAEYRSLVHDDLLGRRLAALDTVEETLAATRLDEEQLLTWMGAVNDLRLVLGTRLDVSEDTDLSPDPDDPEGPALAVYAYLGILLESIVAALAD
ncbi:MAG TPA: DUF2017 family protein [Acidimicrobiales bacterium]|nr:DUF2017 family protein [Acidimicrobiales bacterium]